METLKEGYVCSGNLHYLNASARLHLSSLHAASSLEPLFQLDSHDTTPRPLRILTALGYYGYVLLGSTCQMALTQ